jgi:hypothetical protein
MQPINFPGATEIKKPADMTDEQCSSAFALIHKDDQDRTTGFTTCWKPSYEDLQAFNRGEGVYIFVPYPRLPAMALFTLDENGNSNSS